MEQFTLPLEPESIPPEKPAPPEAPERECPTCGIAIVDGICNCNRPWTGPERSPFKRPKSKK